MATTAQPAGRRTKGCMWLAMAIFGIAVVAVVTLTVIGLTAFLFVYPRRRS